MHAREHRDTEIDGIRLHVVHRIPRRVSEQIKSSALKPVDYRGVNSVNCTSGGKKRTTERGQWINTVLIRLIAYHMMAELHRKAPRYVT